MRFDSSRRSRIARAITALFRTKDFQQDLGYKIEKVGQGPQIYGLTTPSGRRFAVSFSVNMVGDIARVTPSGTDLSPVQAFFDQASSPFGVAYMDFQDPQGRMNMTGEGEAKSIMSKTGAIAYQFLSANTHIAAITFAAGGESRVSLYDRLSEKLSGSHGFAKSFVGDTAFYLVPSSFYQADELEIEEEPADPYQDYEQEPDEMEDDLMMSRLQQL